MWDLAVREEDYRAVDAMLGRWTDAPLSMKILTAYGKRDTAALPRLLDEAHSLDARQSQIAARYVATYLGDFDAAERLARFDLAERRSAAIRLGAQLWLAWLDVGRGRWTAAARSFDEAARMPGGHVVVIDRALAASIPFVDVPRLDVYVARSRVESWDPQSETDQPGLASELRPHLRLYLLGLLSLRLGEHERASRHAAELQRLKRPAHTDALVGALAATIRADVAVQAGRYAEAYALLAAADGEVPLELVYLRPFVTARPFTQEHARYLRAEALVGLGRKQEALRWLENGFQGSHVEFVYNGYVARRRAEMRQTQR